MTASKLLVKREGDFHYPICFEEDFSNLAQVMKEEGLVDRKICIVTDSNVGPLYEESVKQVLSEVSSDISVFTFEAGEKNKNLNTTTARNRRLHHLKRHKKRTFQRHALQFVVQDICC